MPVGRGPGGGGYAAPGELERRVERVDALVREEIGSLPCGREGHREICWRATEALGRLRPHLEGALVALSRIEEGRGLTERELSYRRAFRMLCQKKRS
jgi:hypothetical protein